jgi:hypothetical protein
MIYQGRISKLGELGMNSQEYSGRYLGKSYSHIKSISDFGRELRRGVT